MRWAEGVLVVAAVAALATWLVLRAVRRTASRQEADLPPLPDCAPSGQGLLGPVAARYLGTTYAPSAVRRFSGHGLLGRAEVQLTLDRSGLVVERAGGTLWCLPADALRGASVAAAHAGKHAGTGRVLVVDWMLGPAALRSGFVVGDGVAAKWTTALQALVPA